MPGPAFHRARRVLAVRERPKGISRLDPNQLRREVNGEAEHLEAVIVRRDLGVQCAPTLELVGIHQWRVGDRVGVRDETVCTLEPRGQLPRPFLRAIGRLERNGLFESEALLQGHVDRARKRPRVLVGGHPLHDGKGAHERVMAAVQPPRGAFERGAQAHDAMSSHLPLGVAGLVEVDDEAAQCIVDGHFNYKQRE